MKNESTMKIQQSGRFKTMKNEAQTIYLCLNGYQAEKENPPGWPGRTGKK